MNCYVYRSRRKPGLYVYLPGEDDWSTVPENILNLLGETEQFLELSLTPERRLARCTGAEVIAAIEEQGFYLQMPPG
ncbi:MAG: YcgL domain-containing protein, partial [Thiohalophilus sp.]